jgi:hypothetical protein
VQILILLYHNTLQIVLPGFFVLMPKRRVLLWYRKTRHETNNRPRQIGMSTKAKPMQSETEILERLAILEAKIDSLLRQPRDQESYNVAQFSERVGREEFTTREWCRLGRIKASKRRCGRGTSLEWGISHDELLRYLSEGLLPDPRRERGQS